MRNKTNMLLSALAVADLLFLVCNVPQWLSHYTALALSVPFRSLYFRLQVPPLSAGRFRSLRPTLIVP